MTPGIYKLFSDNQPLPKGTRIRTTTGGVHTGGTHELGDSLLGSANKCPNICSDYVPFWIIGWQGLFGDLFLPGESAPANDGEPDAASGVCAPSALAILKSESDAFYKCVAHVSSKLPPECAIRKLSGMPFLEAVKDYVFVAEARLRELEKDKARLDWIESQSDGSSCIARMSNTGRGFRLHNTGEDSSRMKLARRNFREAIDAAMKGQK